MFTTEATVYIFDLYVEDERRAMEARRRNCARASESNENCACFFEPQLQKLVLTFANIRLLSAMAPALVAYRCCGDDKTKRKSQLQFCWVVVNILSAPKGAWVELLWKSLLQIAALGSDLTISQMRLLCSLGKVKIASLVEGTLKGSLMRVLIEKDTHTQKRASCTIAKLC